MIVESLTVNYDACPTATTIVEQMFCYVQGIVKIPNKSEQSTNYSIQQMTSVRGSFVRQKSYIEKEENKRQSTFNKNVDDSIVQQQKNKKVRKSEIKRQLRSKSSYHEFNLHVANHMLDVDVSSSVEAVCRPEARESKRNDEFTRSKYHVLKEIQANEKPQKYVQSGKSLADTVVIFNENYNKRKLGKDPIVEDEFEKRAKLMNATDIKNDLIASYAIDNKAIITLIKNTRSNQRDDDPTDYACLKVMYADLLKQKNSNNSSPFIWPYKQKQYLNSTQKFYFAKENQI